MSENMTMYSDGSKDFSIRLLERIYDDGFDDDDGDDIPQYLDDTEVPPGRYYIDKELFCKLINLGLLFMEAEAHRPDINSSNIDFYRQTSSNARAKISIRKKDGVPKTGFHLGEDVLLSKTDLLNDAHEFIKNEIFNKKIHDRSVLKTSPKITLRSVSEKSGLNLEGEEKMNGVDMYILTYKSALLKIYAVGNEVDKEKKDKVPLSMKLRSLGKSNNQLKVVQKDFGFKKSELVSSQLIKTSNEVKTDSAYTKSLQFIVGKQKIFDVRIPIKDYIKYSKDSDHQLYFFPQSADDEMENTSSKTFWDPTTQKQMSLFDVDGYWILCFGKTRLLYIIKVNIAPNSNTITGKFDIIDSDIGKKTAGGFVPPPSDKPPPVPQNSKSTEKFLGVNQPKSSNGVGPFMIPYSVDRNYFEIDRPLKIRTYVTNMFDNKMDPFKKIVNLCKEKILDSFKISFFSQNYSLNSMIDIKKLEGMTTKKFVELLSVSEVPIFQKLVQETTERMIESSEDIALDTNNLFKIYDEYLGKVKDLNKEAFYEHEIMNFNIDLTYKYMERCIYLFIKEFAPQNRLLHNLQFVNSEDIHNIGERMNQSEEISTDHILSYMEPLHKFMREIGVFKISKKMNMSETLLKKENFTKFSVYETVNILLSLFVECSENMIYKCNSILSLIHGEDRNSVQNKIFMIETIMKEIFSIPICLYMQENRYNNDRFDVDEMIKKIDNEIYMVTDEIKSKIPNFDVYKNIDNAIIRAQKCIDMISCSSLISLFSLGIMDAQKKFEQEIYFLANVSENGTNVEETEKIKEIIEDNVIIDSSDILSNMLFGSFTDAWSFGSDLKNSAMDTVENYTLMYLSNKLSKNGINMKSTKRKPIFVEINSMVNNNKEKSVTANEQLMELKFLASLRTMVLISMKCVLLYSHMIMDTDVYKNRMTEIKTYTSEIFNNIDCYNKLTFDDLYNNNNNSLQKENYIKHIKTDLANMFL